MDILITGGAGYIGSHTCVALLNSGYRVVVLDNFANSCRESLHRVERISGKTCAFELVDMCNREALADCFSRYDFVGVIHFAGLKSVSESLDLPLDYYRNNLFSTINLCQVMEEFRVGRLIFSSSATVYGVPDFMPVNEACVTATNNPYGRSKLINEEILQDWVLAHTRKYAASLAETGFNPEVIMLRYFNPVGAHESGLMGESPLGVPSNLVPYMAQVATGKREVLQVFGNDYPTADGTGVRDYIHVCDLADGHLAALKWLTEKKSNEPLVEVFNLGTGKGYSVLELVECFQQVSGVKIPYQFTARRSGDVAECYADASKAQNILGWTAERSIREMMEDTWRWQKNNPDGY